MNIKDGKRTSFFRKGDMRNGCHRRIWIEMTNSTVGASISGHEVIKSKCISDHMSEAGDRCVSIDLDAFVNYAQFKGTARIVSFERSCCVRTSDGLNFSHPNAYMWIQIMSKGKFDIGVFDNVVIGVSITSPSHFDDFNCGCGMLLCTMQLCVNSKQRHVTNI